MWKSKIANVLRLSILNGTYSFCNKIFCDRYNFENEVESQKDILESVEVNKIPKEIMFAFDDSCNLVCPSCRKSMVTNRDDEYKSMKQWVDDFMISAGNKTEYLWLSGNGEPFVSRLYRELIKEAFHWRDNMSILCNATLINEKNYIEYLEKYQKMEVVLSIDGATKKRMRSYGKVEDLKL